MLGRPGFSSKRRASIDAATNGREFSLCLIRIHMLQLVGGEQVLWMAQAVPQAAVKRQYRAIRAHSATTTSVEVNELLFGNQSNSEASSKR